MRTTLTVYKASTYVRLTDFKPELVRQVLRPFCKRNFFRFQKVPGELFGTFKWEVKQVYARFNHNETELRFNPSKLEELLRIMESSGYKRSRIKIEDEKKIEAKKVNIPFLNARIKPRNEMQEEYCDFMGGPLSLVVNNMTTGGGKAQPLHSKIKIPGGWSTMGEIKVGDYVTAWDGTPSKVIGVFPQGKKDIYRVTFSDGRNTEVCAEHLWKVYDKSWEIIDTLEIIARLKKTSLYVPLLINENVENNIIGKNLNELGFKQIFINELLETSIEQKKEYLCGFGNVPEFSKLQNKTIFVNCKTYAKQIQELFWSLGQIANIKEGGKLNGWFIELGTFDNKKLLITNVELVSHEEAQCISIDHPDHLYVTDNYVVTHNTFCALYTAKNLGERVLITVLPRYVDIWIKAMGEFYNISPQDILVADILNVQQIHENIKNGICDPKVIILPLSKIDIYLKKCKEDPTLPTLDQIYSDLGIGTRIIDEAHESIYSVYNSLMYGNVNKTIILSATLKGDDEFINGIYSQIFPHTSYLKPPEYTQYIRVISYFHRMKLWEYRINTKGFGGYSHVKFEQGILKRPDVFERYYQMLKGAYDMFYMDEYREGQKSMWFFATIEFCERFNKRLLQDYPELDSIVFNSVTNKKNPTAYREHRNVVTTPGSCGTGKDIKKLYAVFSPIAVSSSQRNDQMVGRTRPIDEWWADLDPIFVYFVCVDEPKQVAYGRKRKGIFTKKMKTFEPIDSGVTV